MSDGGCAGLLFGDGGSLIDVHISGGTMGCDHTVRMYDLNVQELVFHIYYYFTFDVFDFDR